MSEAFKGTQQETATKLFFERYTDFSKGSFFSDDELTELFGKSDHYVWMHNGIKNRLARDHHLHLARVASEGWRIDDDELANVVTRSQIKRADNAIKRGAAVHWLVDPSKLDDVGRSLYEKNGEGLSKRMGIKSLEKSRPKGILEGAAK